MGTLVSGSGDVYLASVTEEGLTPSMDVVYVWNAACLIDANGNRIYLNPGKYAVSDFNGQFFKLMYGSLSGPFLPADSSSDLIVEGCMVLDADGQRGLIRKTATGYSVTSIEAVTVDVVAFGLGGRYSANGKIISHEESATGTMDSWCGLISQYKSIVSGALSSATAMWAMYDSIGSAEPMMSLSAFIPDLANLNLSAEMKYAVGLMCMIQASEAAGMNASVSLEGMRISEESMNLFMTGDILDANGLKLAENAIYTPFTYLHTVQVVKGTTVWENSGFVIVWGSADGWNGEANVSSMKLIPISSGMSTTASKIVFSGVETNSIVLEVKSMSLVLSKYAVDPEAIPAPSSVSDLSWLITVIGCLAGVIVGFIAIRSGSPLMLILAVALLAVGFLMPETILRWFGS